jgi:hypothetical protein
MLSVMRIVNLPSGLTGMVSHASASFRNGVAGTLKT